MSILFVSIYSMEQDCSHRLLYHVDIIIITCPFIYEFIYIVIDLFFIFLIRCNIQHFEFWLICISVVLLNKD